MIDELNTKLKKLREEAEHAIIVVEGNKDVKALQSLGVNTRFIKLVGSPGTLVETAEKLSEEADKAIILTDFDREGKKLTGRFTEILENLGVKVNLSFRKSLRSVLSSQQVEGFAKEVENIRSRLRRDIHGESRYNNREIHYLRENRCRGGS